MLKSAMKITILETAVAPAEKQNSMSFTRYDVTARIEGLGVVKIPVQRPDTAKGTLSDTIEADIHRWMRESLESAGFTFVPTVNQIAQV